MSLLDHARLVAVDTETTGLDPAQGHRVIEVATVVIENGALGADWSSLIRSDRPVPPDASAVHGITDAMLAAAPAPAEVARPLREACGAATLVLHNAAFDLPFLAMLLREGGEPPLWNPVVDTLGLARSLLAAKSHALGALAMQLGLPREARHRALGDARTTARLFLELAARWEQERGVRSLAELAAISQDALRQPRRAPAPEAPAPTLI
jgi:DNA polymerase-3 subunit epsilon